MPEQTVLLPEQSGLFWFQQRPLQPPLCPWVLVMTDGGSVSMVMCQIQ